jgi:hypothetical protein
VDCTHSAAFSGIKLPATVLASGLLTDLAKALNLEHLVHRRESEVGRRALHDIADIVIVELGNRTARPADEKLAGM